MKYILIITFAIVLTSLLGACGTQNNGNNSKEQCTAADISCPGGGAIQACCTGTSCRYVLDGKSYPCNGLDCSEAAQQVVNACLGVGRTSIELENLSINLLIEKTEKLILQHEVDQLYYELEDEGKE